MGARRDEKGRGHSYILYLIHLLHIVRSNQCTRNVTGLAQTWFVQVPLRLVDTGRHYVSSVFQKAFEPRDPQGMIMKEAHISRVGFDDQKYGEPPGQRGELESRND